MPLKTELPFQPIPQQLVTAVNDLQDVIGHWADKKGWNENWDEQLGNFGIPDGLLRRIKLMHKAEKIALIHTEASEALEHLRKKEVGPTGEMIPAMDDKCPTLTGEEAEVADIVIRCLHYCAEFDIDLGNALRVKHEYNITRPYRHGKNS